MIRRNLLPTVCIGIPTAIIGFALVLGMLW